MKYILLSLGVAFLIIGIHQLMTVGIVASYPFLMLSLGLVIGTRLYIMKPSKQDGNNATSKKRG